MLLPLDLRFGSVDAGGAVTATKPADEPYVSLCGTYYDGQLFTRLKVHCKEAGKSDMRYGYANCALPLILDRNTPNSAIPIPWAEANGKLRLPMRALLLRRDRHG